MEIIIYAALGPSGEERALARRLLAEALARERGLTGLPAIAAGANGKPFFPDRPDLQFNLSHSHGAAVCALHHLPIGVDVERLRPAPGGCHGGWTMGIFPLPAKQHYVNYSIHKSLYQDESVTNLADSSICIRASRKIMILRLLCYHPATMSHSQLPPAISTCITNIIYINLPSCYHPSAAKSANPLRPSRLQTSSLLQRAARASIWVLCVPVRAGRLCTLPPILCAWPVRCLMRSPSAVPPLLPPLTRPSRRRPVRLRLPRAGAFGRPLGGSPYRKTRT